MKGKYLILGSNIGDRIKNIKTAVNTIRLYIGNVVRASSIYLTEPWGHTDQAAFYNQVIEIETELDADETLNKVLSIEESMGRVRKKKWAERIIDIDILYFDDQVISKKNLSIPHPGIPDRRFVLVPLCELIPDSIHPVLNISNADLLKATKDQLGVKKILID
jgi:2-amino-4-hydroxy-6-hydroxymethyldihydropteridine diphosphokinase